MASVTLIQNGVDYATASGVGTVAITGSGAGCTLDITVSGGLGGLLDLGVAFNEVTQGVTGNVTVNSV